MYKLSAFILIVALACSGLLVAQPVRNYDDKGAPPFKVLNEGENPPLDVYGNFVIGPKYVAAPERKVVEGVPQGKVQQFVIDSRETKLLNPGIARKQFGTVDPSNPKTLIVETFNIDYKRAITVYVPAQHQANTEAPFMVVHDGPGPSNNPKSSLHPILDNLVAQKRIPPIVVIHIANGGGDAQGHERGREYDNMPSVFADYIEAEVLPRVEKHFNVRPRRPDGDGQQFRQIGGADYGLVQQRFQKQSGSAFCRPAHCAGGISLLVTGPALRRADSRGSQPGIAGNACSRPRANYSQPLECNFVLFTAEVSVAHFVLEVLHFELAQFESCQREIPNHCHLVHKCQTNWRVIRPNNFLLLFSTGFRVLNRPDR
jgi:hypothetical protein